MWLFILLKVKKNIIRKLFKIFPSLWRVRFRFFDFWKSHCDTFGLPTKKEFIGFFDTSRILGEKLVILDQSILYINSFLCNFESVSRNIS